MAQPTAYEQYFLELLNRDRADPAAAAGRLGIGLNDGLEPGSISASAKQPLAWNAALIDAARAHSAWMLATDSFSHTGAGGSDPGDRMADAGYAFAGSWGWGENIAIGYGSGIAITAAQVATFENGLFRSPHHRENILADHYREVGLGLAAGEYRGSAGATGTQDFAVSGSGAFLTGVAFDDADGDRFYDPGEGLGGLTVTIAGGGRTVTTTTWDAGGYQVKLAAGSYSVAFSGGGLEGTVTRNVTIGATNVKLDLDSDAGPGDAALRLSGTAAGEVLTGGGAGDWLAGRGGADTLRGGAGKDVLIGGAGADQLSGGEGADRFVFRSLAEGRDVVTDFAARDGDRLNLVTLFTDAPDDQAGLLADGHVAFRDRADGLHVLVDADGGGDAWTDLVVLKGVTLAGLGGATILIA